MKIDKAIKAEQKLKMQALMIPFKEWLRPYEAMMYTAMERSTLARKCNEYGVRKNKNGYYSRKELDLILSGAPTKFETAAKNIKVGDTYLGTRKR